MYMRQLNKGNFGIVFLGMYRDQNDEGGTLVAGTLVAVKTLLEENSNAAITNFINEANILHKLRHEHIVDFHGVCMEEQPFYLVFEYMDQGDLYGFLRTHSSNPERRYSFAFGERTPSTSTISTNSASLDITQLLDICKQVASGMAYLEKKIYIHCDLACRNCLISTGMTVKISDFGMAHKLDDQDYVQLYGQVTVPLRWMAPESINCGIFSLKSDIWSFGVVVWEVFSFAMVSYLGHNLDAVKGMILRGKLLGKPKGCPTNVFSVVEDSCWNLEPSKRTTFTNLVEVLGILGLSSVFSTDTSEDDTDNASDSNKD